MKKSTKISLLVSLILVIAGAVCIFISLLGVGFDMRKFSNMTFEKKVFEITENLDVHSTNGSIQFSVKTSDRINMETVNGNISISN